MSIATESMYVPGPDKASKAVAETHRIVAAISHFFLVAVRSATRPIAGIRSMEMALAAPTAQLQRNVAQEASPQTVDTK